MIESTEPQSYQQELDFNLNETDDQIVDEDDVGDEVLHNIKTEGFPLSERPEQSRKGRGDLRQGREGERGHPAHYPIEEDRFRRIYQKAMSSKNYVATDGMITRSRRMGFTDEELYLLLMDLKNKKYSKRELMKKYTISESTINRYVRKYNDLGLEKQRTLSYPQQLPKNKNKAPSSNTELSQHDNEASSQASYPPGYQPFPSRKKNSKCRLIEAKLLEIFKQYPQIYQNDAAAMLSKHFRQNISVHVVSRCLRNISNRQKEMQSQEHLSCNEQGIKGFFGNLEENSLENIENRYTFAKQFLNLKGKSVVFTYLDIFTKIEGGKEERIHFALAMTGTGKIVHWKLKPCHFTPEEIAKFILEITIYQQGHTILLDDIRINRELPIIQLLKNKSISYLYLPPFSPHLNPVKRVFVFVAEEFRNRLREGMEPRETLKLANDVIKEAKQKIYIREAEFARYYVDVASKREPFPFDRAPQF